jgi:beta-fructofuranosidase
MRKLLLRLPDHWIWDSWTADDGEQYHLFFLRASRALLDPDRRHLRASIGHATSTDLRNWNVGPDALVHADSPAWDDLATWTGSVVQGDDHRWWLFYTGVSRTERGLVQRIGAAVSDDLVEWHRLGTAPLVEAAPQWYGASTHSIAAWRDPYVIRDPGGDGWHMVLTANARDGPDGMSGVIGHARSDDLRSWEVHPPLTEPAGFSHLEVPQIRVIDGTPWLVFSCGVTGVDPGRRGEEESGSVWSVRGESLLGPWDLSRATLLDHPTVYAGQLVQDRVGRWWVLGFADLPNPHFSGELLDPVPVKIGVNGLELAYEFDESPMEQ